MNTVKQNINLRLQNNTALPQDINIFGNIPNINSANNINTVYEWNLSGQSYVASTSVEISISSTSNPTPITYSVVLLGNNIQGVADALNTLNLGIFQVSGNTMYVLNDFYIYGNLAVLPIAFVSTWNTNNTSGGSSANNQVQLPLTFIGTPTYNFTVYWGDGTSDVITFYSQPETLHTYPAVGIYTITIVGIIDEWTFGNGGGAFDDSQKLLSISSWGTLKFGTVSGLNFTNCVNLDLSSVSDVPDLSATISFLFTFAGCTALTTINRSNEWNTSNITDMIQTFENCSNFNSDISSWDVSNVLFLEGMFQNCLLFNSDISGWITNLNTSLLQTFQNASSFNQPIGNWNTQNVLNMDRTFQDAIAFDQPLDNWDVSSVTSFNDFMFGKSFTNYSSANLDGIYNSWSLLTVQPNLTINFDNIKYTLAGQAGKNILAGAPNNWVITDGGI
jgi:surface protein